MVRKIIPTAGGWGKKVGAFDRHQRAFEQSATRALARLPADTDAWRASLIQALTARVLRHPLPPEVAAAFQQAIVTLVDVEMPILPQQTAGVPTALEALGFRARLRSLLTFRDHADPLLRDWSAAIAHALGRIAASVPANSAAASSPITVPLIDLAPRPSDLVADIVARLLRFAQDDPLAIVPGAVLARQVKEAVLATSKITEDAARKNPNRLVSPKQSGLAGEALVTAFLGGTPFYDLLNMPVPFDVPRDRWATHGIVLAPPEWGKSQLLGLFLRHLLEDADRIAIFLLDPHGDLFGTAVQRVTAERLVVIDPDANPPDLNILDYGVLSRRDALSTFKFLMSSLAGGLSPKQETCIGPLFALLQNIEGANLGTLHQIVTDNPKRGQSAFAEAIRRLDPVYRSFFENLFYSGSFQETKDALQWKLSAALGEPTFNRMFSARRNSIDFDRFIRERKVVLVKGGERSLGKEGMRLFLLFLLGQYYAAGKRRDAIPQKHRHLAVMLADEAHVILQSPVIAEVCTELRKYACAFVGATQLWHQVADTVRPAVLGATGIKIIGKLQHDEATVLARDMDTKPDFIRGLKAMPGKHAEWACHINTVTPYATKITVPYGALEAMPRLRRQPGPETPPPPAYQAPTAPTPRRPASAPPNQNQTGPPAFQIKPGKRWK